MTSRHMLYYHALLVGMSIVLGMSESYSWLAWAEDVAPAVALLLPVNLAFPFVILVLAKREHRAPARTLAAVMLSVALTIAWFFAIFPLVI